MPMSGINTYDIKMQVELLGKRKALVTAGGQGRVTWRGVYKSA